MARDRRMMLWGILRPISSVSRWPLTIAAMVRANTINVLVLIPPPVEPGEAPINIRMIMKNWEAGSIRAMSMVLNPAVRVTTPWK